MAGTKLQIVSCFVLFALLVAPFAYQQTLVERVALPEDRIHALSWNASRFAASSSPEQQHHVRIYLLDEPEAEEAITFTTTSPRMHYEVHALALSEAERGQLRAASTEQKLDDALLSILPSASTSVFSVVLLCAGDGHDEAEPLLVVGKHRHAWSRICSATSTAAMQASFLSTLDVLLQRHVFPPEADVNAQAPPRDTSHARVAVKYQLQFTLLKESAGQDDWVWAFEALQRQYVAPLLQKMESLADFTVEHQVVHYAQLTRDMHRDDEAQGGRHYLLADDLVHFKSTNDFLMTSVLADREQVLHFMAYVPETAHAPLTIRSSHSPHDHDHGRAASSFEIPGWSAVVILDPLTLLQDVHHEQQELRRAFGLFVAQFRTLWGLPSFFHREREMMASRTRLRFLPSPRDGVAQWEIDGVARRLLGRHVKATLATLQSLVQLVVAMPEMSVLARVEHRISTALELVERILCQQGDVYGDVQPCETVETRDTATLLAMARLAVENADAAYYDHTMIRQLYFPQEQMLGVFAPLLAPLLLPFLVGWVREVKRYRAKRTTTLKKATEMAENCM